MDLIFDSIFMTDILISFNTAIFRKGKKLYAIFEGNLVYDRKIIALEYIKLWFWLDLVSSFPYGLVATNVLA
jgi:hyperpolarization activated cyclic nucleotide-gated potassium channel 2